MVHERMFHGGHLEILYFSCTCQSFIFSHEKGKPKKGGKSKEDEIKMKKKFPRKNEKKLKNLKKTKFQKFSKRVVNKSVWH